jgi:hypothetical protein
VRIAPFAISMIWHAKREGDAGLQWLRGVVRDVVASELTKETAPTKNRRAPEPGKKDPGKKHKSKR